MFDEFIPLSVPPNTHTWREFARTEESFAFGRRMPTRVRCSTTSRPQPTGDHRRLSGLQRDDVAWRLGIPVESVFVLQLHSRQGDDLVSVSNKVGNGVHQSTET